MARRRHKMSRRGSRKSFSRNARPHSRNAPRRTVRGGFRL